jgi:phage-related protein
MNITYNNKTPEDCGCMLASKPILTHSEIRRTTYTVPMRGDLLGTDVYRGNASWQILFHMKHNNYMQQIRLVRQWLQNEGILELSDSSDSYYEVKQITWTEDFRKSEEYGRLNTMFTVYPYEFLKSGDTAIEGDGTIENVADPSMPLYKITGSGSGILTVNDKAMNYTVDGVLYIDTRNFIAYDEDGNNKSNQVSGDYEDIQFIHGDNAVSATVGDLETYPRWGYII